MIKTIIIVAGLSSLLATGYYGYRAVKYQKEPVPKAIDMVQLQKTSTPTINNKIGQTGSSRENQPPNVQTSDSINPLPLPIPPSLNLKMTFYSQAPFGNWSMPWQEACEEASVLLVANAYYNKNWTRTQFNDQILNLVDWQNKHFGNYMDTNMAHTGQMLEQVLGLKSITHENPSLADVKTILNKGHLIIMPFAGKKLGNPNYTNGGPVYHVLVIKGYKEGEKVITADVGTRNGEDYVYKWGILQNAMHDFAKPIENGAKRMLEVLPPAENEVLPPALHGF